MANFTLNPVFTGVRRSIGDLTFYSLNGKTHTRLKPGKPYRYTEGRKEHTQAFSDTVDEWRSLPESARGAWDVYGDKKNCRGYNMFIKNNINLIKKSEAVKLTPYSEVSKPVSFSLKSEEGKVQADFTLPAEAQNLHLTLVYRETGSQPYGNKSFEIKNLGINPQSPAVIEGLLQGRGYDFYAVLSSDEFAKTQKISESVYAKITV